jgi:ATP-binding cassette, subfamily F, member 3
MIRANNLALRRGDKLLFSGAEFSIFPGQKVAVVGRNGCGKSSLFAVFQHGLEVDTGALSVPSAWRVAAVSQTIPDSALSALAFVMAADTVVAALNAALANDPEDSMQHAHLLQDLLDAGGYTLEARAARLLDGLGFSFDAQQQPVHSFSGGWRMRLALACALLAPSDLLLLDEPTNHLDLDTLLWLEDWLRSYPGTLLTISHDREFLDAVCTQTLHLDGSIATLYQGNYSSFARQRHERRVLAQAQAQAVERRRGELQRFVDRFKAKASKAKQAQSRMKMLERLESAPVPADERDFELSIPTPDKLPSTLLSLAETSVGYGENIILHGLKLSIGPQERIGLLGRNGAGKSTLMKLMAGQLAACAGERTTARETLIGYFDQHQVELLDASRSPIQLMRDLAPQLSEQNIRDWLGRFAYSGDLATQACGPRSGGEKARLALALLLWRKPNLLLLDEPTNHLDLAMRQALAEAIRDYEGAVVLVSHDRALLSASCEQFYLVHDGEMDVYSGDLDEYAAWQSQQRAVAKAEAKVERAEAKPAAGKVNPKSAQRALDKLENKMTQAQATLHALQADLNAASANSDSARIVALSQQIKAAERALEDAESAWLEAAA